MRRSPLLQKATPVRNSAWFIRTVSKKVIVPGGVPIVTTSGGTAANLRAPLPVFVVVIQKASGEMTAPRIAAGKHSVALPM